MKFVVLIPFVLAVAPCQAQAQATNNDTIVALARGGLGEGVIIDKIETSPCNYDVSTDALLALKRAGISDNVLSAMMRRCASLNEQRGIAGDDASPDPTVRHSPGIYLARSWETPQKLQILRPSKSSGTHSTGNGSILFPYVLKMVVPGTEAQVQAPSGSPTFYFYFNVSSSRVSDFGLENSAAAQSPNEFSLVRFKAKGGSREVSIGKASYFEGAPMGTRKGIDPKYTVGFDSEEVRPGIFKVTLGRGLDPGDYAFVFTGANGTSRIYDFSIASPATGTPPTPGK